MCLDCGCMQPDNTHGDDRHITMKELVDAADANGFSAQETLTNIEETTKAVLEGRLQSEAMGEAGMSGKTAGAG